MKRTVIIFAVFILLAATLCSCSYTKPQASIAVADRGVINAYKQKLVENIYHRSGLKPDEFPTYALYDFEGDGVPELLVWDIRRSTASFRDIFVYRYNTVTSEAEHVGTMLDFTGHSLITESVNGREIVIAICDSGKQDKIISYTLTDGTLTPTILARRTDETTRDWHDLIYSPDFNSGVTLETSNTYTALEKEFDKK